MVTVQIGMHDQGLQNISHHLICRFSDNSSKTPMVNMPGLLWTNTGIRYFRYPGLSKNKNLEHGVFTRRGGESAPPFQSLNTSFSVGDLPKHVTGNLSRIKNTLGAKHLVFMNQSHGTKIAILGKEPLKDTTPARDADAMVTRAPGIALMVQQADCQSIIIFDPVKKVIANIHCGWRGNVRNILGKVIVRMGREFDCRAKDLLAAVGPSLGPCCSEFLDHRQIFPKNFEHFIIRKNYFDLWAISCSQMAAAGVREKNIECARICTRCRTDLFFSYRGEGETGRFATVAMLV